MKYVRILKKKVHDREQKLKGEVEDDEETDSEEEPDDVADADQFPLLNISDDQLSPEQLKEKKKQRLLKAGKDFRKRKQVEKERLAEEASRRKAAERQRYQADPASFMADLFSRREAIAEKRRQRIKSRNELQDRKSSAVKKRMLLLAGMTTDKLDLDQEDQDTFGANDADWEIYRQVQVGKAVEVDDPESEDEKAQIKSIEDLIREFEPHRALEVGLSNDGMELEPLTDKQRAAKYFQFSVNFERIRAPELIFQPSMMGADQAGLAECISVVASRLSREEQDEIMSNLFVTGGLCKMSGFLKRIQKEYRLVVRYGQDFQVIQAKDPSCDSWKGAALFAQGESFDLFCASNHKFKRNLPTNLNRTGDLAMDQFIEHINSNIYTPTPKSR
eukprot:TRINITY_DN15596_c0_g2_i1.p1 TRINITY_DN15596_c0_g2~~TRINITY_DN15596_c0_g2_i1.p1  ORF type:complete len:389 (+),score=129.60 TRINITY_DN15596_c0_g2_i1:379-1545(+)